jgi:hypothetical protein
MRRVVLGAIFLLTGALSIMGRPTHHAEADDSGAVLNVGGLLFAIPDRWEKEPLQSSARAAQWHIAPPRGQTGDGVEIVIFFFGPGIGGTAKENIDAWAGTMSASNENPATADPQGRTIAGHKVTQVLLSGTYSQVNFQPGIPPILKPNYSLLGAVIENAAGNVYWRMTGPALQVAALEPVVTKILDGLKPQPPPKP